MRAVGERVASILRTRRPLFSGVCALVALMIEPWCLTCEVRSRAHDGPMGFLWNNVENFCHVFESQMAAAGGGSGTLGLRRALDTHPPHPRRKQIAECVFTAEGDSPQHVSRIYTLRRVLASTPPFISQSPPIRDKGMRTWISRQTDSRETSNTAQTMACCERARAMRSIC